MNTIVENRAWLTYCRLNSSIFEEKSIHVKENRIRKEALYSFQKGISELKYLNAANLYINPEIVAFSNDSGFEITVNETGLKLFSKLLSDLPNLNVTEIKLTILDTGFISHTTRYDYSGENESNTIDQQCIESSGVVDDFFNEIISLTDRLITTGILVKNDYFYFGVPQFLSPEIKRESSYMNSFHLFIANHGNYKQFAKECTEDRKNSFDGINYCLLKGNYIFVWESAFQYAIHNKAIFTDFRANCENCLHWVILNMSKIVLSKIDTLKIVDSIAYRKTITAINEIQLSFQLAYYFFDMEEREFYNFGNKCYNKEYWDSQTKLAIEALQYSIVSKEEERKQHVDRRIQIILSIFTSLTLISVCNDIISIINLNDFPSTYFLSFKLLGLSALIVLDIILIFFIYKKSK